MFYMYFRKTIAQTPPTSKQAYKCVTSHPLLQWPPNLSDLILLQYYIP
jgi:hypothetical protein